MKKDKLRISKIIIRDPKSTMSPEEYRIWKDNWMRLLAKMIATAIQKDMADKKKRVKVKATPKRELVKSCFELAEQLEIKLPRSFGALYYDDIFFIKLQLEYELRLKNTEEEGCEVVFEPPRLPNSEIIAMSIERAKIHKAMGLRYYIDW